MELVLYAAAFYAWQCLVHLPAAGSAWLRMPFFGWTRIAGPGLRLLSPWPGARVVLSSGFDFELTPHAVFARATTAFAAVERRLPLDAVGAVERRGPRLFAAGSELLRATSEGEARELASVFARLARTPERERPSAIESFLAHAFAADACRERFRAARAATRTLRWACDAEFVLAFVVAAALARPLGDAAAWLLIVPALAIAHAVALAGLWLAERRLETARGDRLGRFVVGALFPPALLRLPCELVSARLAPFHPATIAAVTLPRALAEPVLRAAIGTAAHPHWRRRGSGSPEDLEERDRYAACVADGLLGLAKAVGIEPDRLRAVPLAPDAVVASWCPICLDEFRPGFRACTGCGVATVRFPGADPAAP